MKVLAALVSAGSRFSSEQEEQEERHQDQGQRPEPADPFSKEKALSFRVKREKR